MSDHPDDLTPDPAALDELLRAFGLDADPEADAAGTADGAELVGEEPIELVIVEQEPLRDPSPPKIIRIDDYSGTVATERADRSAADADDEQDDHVDREIDDDGDEGDDGDDVDDGDGDGEGEGEEHEAAESVAVDDAPTPAPTAPAAGVAGSEPDEGDAVPTVITIDDGDLPDPVYVEGNLERGGNRAIVFIEDDDTGDALAPEAERDVRRGIEPRMRERRAAVKRAMGRRRLRWVLGITLLLVLGVGVLAVLGSDLFAIQRDQVTVIGAVYADPDEVAAVVDDLVGTPALLVDTQGAERRLEAIPWVHTAKVTVDFPHRATIDIRERAAISTYQGPDGRFRVLDREGRVVSLRSGLQPIAYVLISGPDPVDLDAGEFAPRGYAAASELARNLTSTVRPQVERIVVTADGSSLDLLLTDDTVVRFGQARDLFEKLVRLETVLAANPDREPGMIDVSTSEVTL
ncbi:MAG: FtsQ-type POTRA domain-containing protein [Ilumatobacter sp.]|nr:FtsQ-type POTRA domain-containing protein [Ilumatobacter sp.]